jgi:membrane protein DedA with SNARE-associated domain
MAFLTQVHHAVEAYPLLIPVMGGLAGGEETIFLLSVVAAHGYLDIEMVAAGCYAGILAADITWYFFGKTRVFDRLVKRRGVSETYQLLHKALGKATQGSDFLALLATKFLYGFRLITIMQLSREGMALATFVLCSAVIDAIWIAVVTSVGWSAGKGMEFARLVSNNLAVSFAFLGIFMAIGAILMRVASRQLRRWLTKK